MARQEYKVVVHTYGRLSDTGMEEQKINEVAQEGWELVCVGFAFEKETSTPTTKLYFKRDPQGVN